MGKKIFSIFLYSIYVLLIVCIGLEIFLRFYSPIEVRISSGKIVLPKNQKYLLPNTNFTKLKKNAIHTKNSWGFRGEEWDADSKRTKLLFVGGSTTECYYTDDKNVWTSLYAESLGDRFLVNNAGLNGHSSFGHITLLQEYITEVKPDYVFFLVGINDVATTENGGNNFDNKLSGKGFEGILLKIEERSRLLNLLHSFYRSYQAKKSDLADNIEWVLEKKESDYKLSNKEIEDLNQKHKTAQTAYQERLIKLIKICIDAGAEPVFISQPLLFGQAVDPTTGIDLSGYAIYGMNGLEYFNKLEFYNQTLRKVAKENHVGLVDLGALLPHDSKYYFDDMHFSDAGAVKIAQILKEKISFDSDNKLHINE